MHLRQHRQKISESAIMKKLLILATIQFVVLACSSIPVQAQGSTVSVNLNQTSEPISKYIYGQFIEHLGRCIYGGIWAEMLEDRKFYYPVDGQAPAWTMYKPGMRSYDGEGHPYELLTRSPWMIIGDKKAVSMMTENSYVGEHTPRITLSGNRQPDRKSVV